jgi:hypothetical protein
MVADCSFPLAHGMAFVSDLGAQDFAMTSLALVIPPRGRKSGERLGN